MPPILTFKQYQYIIENKNSCYGNDINIVSIYEKNSEYYITNLQKISLSNNAKSLIDECRKKYIPHNNSYVMIIPNENNLKISNGQFLKEFDSNILAGHGEVFRDFCMKYMIPIEKFSECGYNWGMELASCGFLSIQKEDNEMYLYIPSILSDNQSNWFDNNKDYLLNFEFLEAVVWLNENRCEEIFKYKDNGNIKTNKELVEEIYEQVAEIKNRSRCI